VVQEENVNALRKVFAEIGVNLLGTA